MLVNQLYYTWFQQVRQSWLKEHITRLSNLVWLMVGIYQSRCLSAWLSTKELSLLDKAHNCSLANR